MPRHANLSASFWTSRSSTATLLVGNQRRERPMPSLIPDFATFERRLAGLPVVKHGAREVVLTAGSKTSGLLFLRSGTVEVVKDGVQIPSVNAPGSVFGELAVLGPTLYNRREDSGAS